MQPQVTYALGDYERACSNKRNWGNNLEAIQKGENLGFSQDPKMNEHLT
jgi:hypothetical protein